jgi:serine protease inhibitor
VPRVDVSVDVAHPFLFALVDRAARLVLLLGGVVEPTDA